MLLPSFYLFTLYIRIIEAGYQTVDIQIKMAYVYCVTVVGGISVLLACMWVKAPLLILPLLQKDDQDVFGVPSE